MRPEAERWAFERVKGAALRVRYTGPREEATVAWIDVIVHAMREQAPGRVIEDPATGAAAAALGGYLRDAGLVSPPFEFQILQGETMGMPSRIFVNVPNEGGIIVRGAARSI